MSTYNNAACTLQCPRCLQTAKVHVSLYVGDTSRMCAVRIGDIYPFRLGCQPQNGGPFEGPDEDGGYAECPNCGRDFFCEVEFRDLRLIAIRASRSVPPYGPDEIAEGVFPCPRCGHRQTRHFKFDNMETGRFFCDRGDCQFGTVTVWDSERRVYHADGAEFAHAQD